MLIPLAIGKVLVLEFQALKEIGIHITPVFVDKLVVAVAGHRIVMRRLVVRLLQQLRETEAFWCYGFVEFEI